MPRTSHQDSSPRKARRRAAAIVRQKSRKALVRRLHIEELEERRMLSVVTWINQNAGDWDDASNWSTNHVPGSADDVVIPALNFGGAVSISKLVVHDIHSLTSDAPLVINGLDGLQLTGGAGLIGNTPRGLLKDSAGIVINGSSLAAADIQAGTTVTTTAAGANLQDITLRGILSFVDAKATVQQSLTLADGGQITVGDAGELELVEATIDGTGNIVLGTSGSPGLVGTISTIGSPVTLGPGITVHGTGGLIKSSIGNLINEGIIEPDYGRTFSITGNWSNAAGASLKANNGTLNLEGNWSNAGLLELDNGSTANLSGNWSNTGQFTTNQSTLNLGGTFTTAAGPNSITSNGGTVNLTGTLNNTGSTLILDAATGSWNLAGGSLKGGALVTLDGTVLNSTYSGGALDGLTLGTAIGGVDEPGEFLVATGAATIANGLTLGNLGLVEISAATFLPTVSFVGNQSVTGTGQIQFASRGGTMKVAGNMTMGPGVTLHGGNGSLLVTSGSLINQGTIDADTGGIEFGLFGGTSWTNAAGGILEATSGGNMYFDPTTASWTNAAGALLETTSNSTLSLAGSWSNTGAIVVQNGTLNLGGNFATADLANFTRTGGVVNVTGQLNNAGSTLVLGATKGSWILEGGTIQGGALATLGSQNLQTDAGGTLSGLTLGATVAGQPQPGNVLVATGSAAVNGGLTLANGSVIQVNAATFLPQISFNGNQTVGGNGQIVFAGRGGAMQVQGNLTLGAGVTLHGTNGTVNIQSGSVLNQGTIDADGGGPLTLQGAAGTSWSSTGLITSHNSTLELGGYFKTSTIGTIDATQGFIGIAGTLTNDIPLVLNDITGALVLDGGIIIGGLITTTAGAELLVKGGGTLNGVTIQGTLDDSLYGSGLSPLITNGLTLVGATIALAGTNSLTFTGTEALSGTGTISIDSQGGGNQGLLLLGTNTALTIAPGISIHGHGYIGSTAGSTVTMNGTVNADDGGTLAIQGATNLAGGALTGGTWEATNNSKLEIIGSQITTNAAKIVLSGPSSHIYSDLGSTSALSTLAANASGAQLTITGGANITDTAALTNAGVVSLGLNSTLTVASYLQTGGGTSLQWGTLATAPHAGINIQGGMFSGPGSVQGDLTNAASLDLGIATGTLNVTGNFTQTPTGALTVALGGTSPSKQYDQVIVNGTANLGGTLDIKLVNGFGTAIGQTFTVLSFAGENGNFSTTSGLSVGGQAILNPILNPTNLTLQAISNQPDLIVTNAAVTSTNAFAGQPITVNFTIKNQGGSALTGSWVDTIFLSSLTTLDPSAIMIGHVTHNGGLAVGASYQGTLTAILPGTAEGNYHVLVEADGQSLEPDVDRSNNVLASAALAVAIPTITPGTPISGSIASGQDVYYRVNVPAGQDVKLTANFTSPSQADFLVRALQFPTVSTFDHDYPTPSDLIQSLILPGSQPGATYILLHGRGAAGAGQSFTLSVSTSSLEIQKYALQSYATQGITTYALTGAGFTPHTTVRLVDASSTAYAAMSVTYADSTHIFAAFNLNAMPPGTYQLEALDNGNTAFAPKPLVNDADVNETTVAQGQLSPHEAGGYISVGGSIDVILNVRNQTGHDVIAPVIEVTGTNVALKQNPLTIYPFGQGTDGGLLPVVGPYSHVKLDISAPVVPAQAGVGGTIGYGVVDLQAPIDWNSQKDVLRPSNISADAWDAIYANFIQALGPTPAVMQQVLFNDELYLSSLGESVTSVDQLMGYELMKAEDAMTGPSLNTAVDDSIPAPGTPLSFQRTYIQSLDGRYRLGTLGRGWVSNWDISASTDAAGKVTIFDAGHIRVFTPMSGGGYQSEPGDYGALNLVGGVYQLREKDGTITAFLHDGRLNYIQDANGNRVTAGYNGTQLMTLTHSDGDSLFLVYNPQGRISQIIDSAGWSTTYTYDGSGQHLLSVSNPSGTTQYTYIDGANIEQEHALQSITHADGTHTNFSYDALGRLSQQSGDGGSGQLNYTYFNPGGYTITDANNAVTQILYDVNGQPAQTTDPLGNITQLRYDSNGQLIMSGLVGGLSTSFTYDANGNVTKIVDPLGNTSQFSYNPLFGSLENYVDPLGNATGYQQDGQGNPLGITYPNFSSMQATSDASGNLIQAVDARGQIVANDYNGRGQIIDQTLSDGTHIVYTYDNQGNLASATDANGTTTLTYDNAHHLTKIAYPNNQYLKYTYDAGGRRSSMTDQTGFTVNYQYDAVGRLAVLSDGQNNLIASYSYDAAGRLLCEDMGNGTYTTYTYDLAGNTKSLINYAPNNSINSRFDYTYDANGLRTTMTTLQGTTTYGYNAAGELTSVLLPGNRTITYSYDATGNRTEVSDSGVATDYTTNNLNQYTSVGGTSYTYDAAGNLIVKVGGGTGTIYTYDTEDRLTGVQNATDTWIYQYDALGNRIGAIHNGQAEHFLIDPLGQNALVGEFDSKGNLLAHYTQGIGLTSRIDASNAKTFYNFDGSGNTVGISGSAGTYVNSYSYLPFGEIQSSAQTIANPFQFGGQLGVMAQGNGLNIMGARFYDPATGRFLSRDPIGIAGGGNIYEYATNNPVTQADPTGFYPVGYGYGPAANLGFYGGQASSYGSQTVYVVNADLTSTVVTGAKTAVASVEENPGVWSTVTAAASGAWATFNTWAAGTALGEATGIFGLSVGAGGAALLATVASIGAAIVSVGLVFDQASKLYQEWPRVAPHYDVIKDQNGEYSVVQIAAVDPNYISGPAGYGSQGFIQPQTELPYEIGFENESDALAPAQTVTITEQIDPNLDWSTFQLGDFGFGGRTYTVPAGRQFYTTRIDATSSVGVFVDVTGNFDEQTGLLTWQFTSIDPETLDEPKGIVLEGFLPPDKTAPEGQGWVSYTVLPKASDLSGTVIQAMASVVFNTNAPIDTPKALNTIDATAPESSVTALPQTSSPSFGVSWSGNDNPGGSGIAGYDIYVSDNGGVYTPFLLGTAATSATFTGQSGHTYSFYSVATDNVGNIEPTPASAQAQTFVLVGAGTSTAIQSSQNPSPYGSIVTFTATVSATQPGADVPSGAVQFVVDGANVGSPVTLVNGAATSPTLGALGVGNHSIIALYIPDSTEFSGSQASLAGGESITKAETSVSVESSLAAPVYGDALTFTAFVAPTNPALATPTGAVQFLLNGVSFGAPVILVNGIATTLPISSLGAGTYLVSAVYSGSGPLASAVADDLPITISRALLSISADDKKRIYGQANPAFTYTVMGLVNGDSASVLSGSPSFSTTATAASHVGSYPITIDTGTLSAANYDITQFDSGTLTINQAALTVRADHQTKVYGQTLPNLTATFSGFVNGDTLAVVGGAPSLSTTATAASPVGTYPITVTLATLSALDYTFSAVNGSLDVTKAHLTVTANDQDMGHGDAVPALTDAITGFVNGDLPSVIAGVPKLSTTATSLSAAGQYPINVDVSGVSATNYDFNGIPGTLTVHPKVTDVRVHWGKQSISIVGLNRDLPFATIQSLEVIFSDPVQAPDASALSLTSRSNSGVNYLPSTSGTTASADVTWNLPSAIGIDALLLSLDKTRIGALVGAKSIGLFGANSWNFDVLPGDFNGDRTVTTVDAIYTRNDMVGPYVTWADFNGDGIVDVNDVIFVQKKIGTKLPPSN